MTFWTSRSFFLAWMRANFASRFAAFSLCRPSCSSCWRISASTASILPSCFRSFFFLAMPSEAAFLACSFWVASASRAALLSAFLCSSLAEALAHKFWRITCWSWASSFLRSSRACAVRSMLSRKAVRSACSRIAFCSSRSSRFSQFSIRRSSAASSAAYLSWRALCAAAFSSRLAWRCAAIFCAVANRSFSCSFSRIRISASEAAALLSSLSLMICSRLRSLSP
mmetsp:Transcript_2507/g.5821  ORF Transcript_2507/g.5821 Transcript_2507/m.5821 type:complete len:225 (-) Transcript_2507:1092-1766(-)